MSNMKRKYKHAQMYKAQNTQSTKNS